MVSPTPTLTATDPALSQLMASAPQASVWVMASAGSGKTKVLTDRVLRLLLAGAHPTRILCLTFTKAAAAEMATRIADRLAGWAVADGAELATELTGLAGTPPDQAGIDRARRLFATVLDAPGGLTVQTIHAFCQSVLQRFPLEAGLPPGFAVLDERTAAERLRMARDRMIRDARPDRSQALPEALIELSSRVSEDVFSRLVGALLSERAKLRQAAGSAGGMAGLEALLRRHHGVGVADTDTTLLEAAAVETAFDATGLQRAARALAKGSKSDIERAATIGRWLENPETRLTEYAAYRSAFLIQSGDPRKILATRRVSQVDPEAIPTLEAEAMRLQGLENRRRSVDCVVRTIALIRIALHVLEIYEADKLRHGFVDYDDLVIAVRNLLRRSDFASWVLYKLDGGLDHVLIDEAQDTNPEQWQIAEALTEEFFAGSGRADARAQPERTVFAVGDIKQSIFSFQRADPQGFLDTRERFASRVQEVGQVWEDVRLDVSFRSTSVVLQAVDAVFNTALARCGVVDDGAELKHHCHRVGQAGRVEIWPPVEPDDEVFASGWQLPTTQRKRSDPRLRLAKRIAEQIKAWITNREILDSKGRPIRPGDIMILVRRRGPFVDELVRELKTHGVDVAGVDRMVLTDQLAVMDLVALGNVLLLPEDDLTLATVLKGPIIGFSEDELYDLCRERSRPRLWQELQRRAAADTRYRDVFTYLSELRRRADFVPPYEMFAEILARGGRRKLLDRLGPEAADPLDEFLAQALAFERSHVPSLQGFLHWLAAAEFEVKRDLETGHADQVRILTVHGSKGLQAPIIFLPDSVQPPSGTPDLLWTRSDGIELPLWSPRQDADDAVAGAARSASADKRDQEYRRLLYVAMTRAEDRLYIAGWNNKTKAEPVGWHRMARDGLAPLAGSQTDGLILEEPQQAEPDGPPSPPMRRQRPTRLPDWARRAPAPESRSSRPLRPSRPEEDPPVRSPFDSGDSRRFRRGRIIHFLLQWLPLVPCKQRRRAAQAYLARSVHGLAPTDQETYAAEVMALLDDQRFAALFSPAAMAEAPIVGSIGDAGEPVLVSGRIDRLLVLESEVLAVDFKTNRPPPQQAENVSRVYLRQMTAYRELLRQLYPDRPVRCALLWTDGPRLMELPDRLLDDFVMQARRPVGP